MIKIKQIITGFVLAVSLVVPAAAWGQVTNSAGVSGSAVSGASGLAAFDGDTSNDDIVQLSNLTVQNISGTALPAIVTASYDFGVRCEKFMSQNPNVRQLFPCPASPSILYQIKVDEKTILLWRDRSRAALAGFTVGDRINVYGFMDRANSAIEALIMRDLDKPVRRKFIQLNNVTVNSAPSPAEPPSSFTVVQNTPAPCYDFGTGTSAAITIPCPVGLPTAGGGSNLAAPSSSASGSGKQAPQYYLWPKKYLIEVGAGTVIYDRMRNPIKLSQVEAGDSLNIYGSMTADAKVTAQVIRDLSEPKNQSAGILRVFLSDNNIVCAMPLGAYWAGVPTASTGITFPCGIVYDGTVLLYNESGNLARKQSTNTGVATFEDLSAGNYTLIAQAPGFNDWKEQISLGDGETKYIYLRLIKAKSGSISVNTKAPLYGAVNQYFEAYFTAEGGQAPYSWSVEGDLPPGLSLAQATSGVAPISSSANSPTQLYSAYSNSSGVAIIYGTPAKTGEFSFGLKVKDSSGNAGQAKFIITISDFKVSAPAIDSIQPVSGPVGMPVTLSGTGFTSGFVGQGCAFCNTTLGFNLVNTVNFGPATIPNVISDGKTLTFTVPGTYMPPCPTGLDCAQVMSVLQPGTYDVSVTNSNGTSNAVKFTLTTAPTTARGTLEIVPGGPQNIQVGDSVSLQAWYHPPMPDCNTPWTACIQIMPAPVAVTASWSSDNSNVAMVTGYAATALVRAVAQGNASITATYTPPSGGSLTQIVPVTVKGVSGQPSIQVISPNGGEVFKIGETHTINWTNQGATATNYNVQIGIIDTRYSTEVGPRGEAVIANSIPNSGSYSWVIPSSVGAMALDDTNQPVYKIVVHSWSDTVTGVALSDSSDGPFSIMAASQNSVSSGVTISSILPNSGPPGTSVVILGSGFTALGNTIIIYKPDLTEWRRYSNIKSVTADGTSIIASVPYDIPYDPQSTNRFYIQIINGNGVASLGAAKYFMVTSSVAYGSITSMTPNPCPVAPGAARCQATVIWSASGAPNAGVRAKDSISGWEGIICNAGQTYCVFSAAPGHFTVSLLSNVNDPNSQILDQKTGDVIVSSSTGTALSIDTLPTVDLKINGSDGPLSIPYSNTAKTSVTFSWTSTNATFCYSNFYGIEPVSGSQTVGITAASQTFTMTCSGFAGSASDSVTVNASSSGADIIPVSILPAGPFTEGQSVKFTITVKNQGESITPGSFEGDLMVDYHMLHSSCLTFGGGCSAYVTPYFSVPQLAAGATYTTTVNWTATCGSLGNPCQDTIRLRVDPQNVQAESNENNNFLNVFVAVN